MTVRNPFSWLPAVDEVLSHQSLEPYFLVPRVLVLETVRQILEKYRQELRQNPDSFPTEEELKKAVYLDICRLLENQGQPKLRPVINATGVVLHTNLGRAVLSEKARQAVMMTAAGYSNLEMDLETGNRGSRYDHVSELLRKLTGAEDCLVVNNNAAAVLLALDTLAKGKESIVSRGELVEIGGAFRIPDVMERSGSRLVEVGTTNKTYVSDYERAITSETGLLLKVHTSNFRVMGFTHEATIQELAELARSRELPLMDDLGSGCLFDLKEAGVGDEPRVSRLVADGADIVTFSGDKLLGGPQAGIIVGRREYISLMKKNPLTRALRIDKMTVAALEATLSIYLEPDRAAKEVPTIEMLTRPLDLLKEQAKSLAKVLVASVQDALEIKTEAGLSPVGGGSLPTVELPTAVVMIRPTKVSAQNLAAALRMGNPAVLVYIREDWLILDPRTILEGEAPLLVEAFQKACGGI